MNDPGPRPPLPAAESPLVIEPAPRRRAPLAVFGAMIAGLLTVGLWSWLAPTVRPTGLPDEPEVRAARELTAGGLPLAIPDLALVTSLAGESRWTEPDALPVARLAAARARLVKLAERRPSDPRVTVAVAHLSLAAMRLDDAIARYRDALERAPRYGEARLGLGVALAGRGLLVADEDVRRARALEAVGQFANVDPGDPAHPAALYDRALLLGRLGRAREAKALLERELAAQPAGAWSGRYRRVLAGL